MVGLCGETILLVAVMGFLDRPRSAVQGLFWLRGRFPAFYRIRSAGAISSCWPAGCSMKHRRAISSGGDRFERRW